MFKLINLLVLLLSGVAIQVNGATWCELEAQHCSGQEHIGCTPNSFPVGQCSNVVVVPMTETLMNFIVNRHNQHRSTTATGGISHLPTASRMRQMSWDADLATLAEIHVRHCNFAHDQCRATTDFPYAGQNLAMSASSQPDTNQQNRLQMAIDSWFNEYQQTTASNIDSIPSNINNIGHFTVMMRENNIRVGCAYITYNYSQSGTNWYAHMITCNYADNNFVGSPVYTRGAACSQCSSIGSTCSTIYSGLCV